MTHRTWVWGVLAVLLTAVASNADVVVLTPVDDTTINTQFPDDPGNGLHLVLEGWISGYTARPLLKFDLSSIPDDATLLSVELTLLHDLWNGNSAASFSTEIWRLPYDNWSEVTATWNSCDQSNGVVIATRQAQPENWNVIEPWVWNIRIADWNYATDLLDDTATFEVRWSDESNQWWKYTGFRAREGDVAPTLRIEFAPCNLPGDLNADGQVDLTDLAKILSHYGMLGGATYAHGDLNGDGNVDLTDLALLLANYGAVCT